MANLPTNRTKLQTVLTNEQPGTTAASQAHREWNVEMADTLDLLNQKVDTSITSGTLSPLPPDYLWRQGFINAGLEVSQQYGTSAVTIANNSSLYVVDQVKTFNNGSGVNATAQQVAVSDLDGAVNGLKIVHAATPSAGGKLAHTITVEAKDAYKFGGLQVVYALKVAGVLGMDQVSINARYKTSESALDSASTLILSTGVKAINNLGWTVVPLVVNIPTRAVLTTTGVIGIEIVFSKSTAEASGDGGIIAELELIKGGTDLGFQPRSYDDELIRCMRYFEWLDFNSLVGLVRAGTQYIAAKYPFKVQKRIAPSLSGASDLSTTLGTGSKQVTLIRASDNLALTATGNVTILADNSIYMTKNIGSLNFQAVTSFNGTAGDAIYINQTVKDTICGFDARL